MDNDDFINREDEIDPEENREGGDVTHEIVLKFVWTDSFRTTDGVAESVERDQEPDEQVIATCVDVWLDPVGNEFNTSDVSVTVTSKKTTVKYWDEGSA